MKPESHFTQIPQTERPMETFPQPQTIPGGWDTSDMFTGTQTGFDLNSTAESTEETGSDKWDVH